MADQVTFKQPAAFLPIAMSTVAMAVLVTHIALFGIVREADEGTSAHIWQLLMAGQLPVMGYFALTALPRDPRRALMVLAVQVAAALAAAAPVFILDL